MSLISYNDKPITFNNKIITPPPKPLNDYTWAEIRAISDSGKATDYF